MSDYCVTLHHKATQRPQGQTAAALLNTTDGFISFQSRNVTLSERLMATRFIQTKETTVWIWDLFITTHQLSLLSVVLQTEYRAHSQISTFSYFFCFFLPTILSDYPMMHQWLFISISMHVCRMLALHSVPAAQLMLIKKKYKNNT